uniref:Uncharacterized protein n=1 Tax=viral metagenome TaxID=1070528 RepID=A0A6M3KQP3_9ZZZZ
MRFIKDLLADILFPKGYFVGFGLIISPYIWDILWKGTEKLGNIVICDRGVIVQVVGIVLVIGAYCSEKYLNQRTGR